MINNAKQIWIDNISVNQYIEARQTFCCSGTENAVLQIYSETEYVVYINGEFAGCGQYKSMPDVRVFDEYEISSLLKNGENEIFVISHHQGIGSSVYAPSAPGIAYAVTAGDETALSGDDTAVRISPYYKSGDIEKITNQLGPSYHYDASKAETSWTKAAVIESSAPFVSRPVKKLVHGSLFEGKLLTQGVLKRESDNGTPAELMHSDFLSFRPKNEVFDENGFINSDAYFVIDLEKETAGLISFSVDAPEGTVIDIGYGEHLDDLRVRTYVGKRNFAVRYICKEGNQNFTGYFRRIAGRYLQVHITNLKSKARFSKIGIIPTEYPISKTADFWCNDYLFNKIYDVSVTSLKLCMHEHYEDCPWREQALYGFDSYVQMLCGYYAFGEYDFAKASLKLLAESIREDGLVNITSPNTENYTIPSFSLSWIISLQKYVLYSGDTQFAKEMKPVVEKILAAFPIENCLVQNMQKDCYWHFYEWRDGASRIVEKTDCIINLLYILAAEAYNKLCGFDEIDVSGIKEAVKEEFYDKNKQLFRTSKESLLFHELTQSLAILCGLGDDSLAEKLISKDTGLVKTTLSTSIFKYDALLSRGNRHLNAIINEIAETWGKMLYSGATTFWETEDGADDFDRAGSLCHGWSAVPVYILFRYVLGFEPLSNGFSEYRFEPSKTENISKFKTTLYMPGREITANE